MWTSSEVLVLIGFLCWGSGVACVLHLRVDPFFQATLRRHWFALLVLVLIAAAWRYPHTGQFFHGLEYEDSYVYTVVGRQLSLGYAPLTRGMSPSLTTVCAVGSLEECESVETYSGHYLGLPFLVASLSNLVGYRPDIASLLAMLSSCLSVVMVFHLGRMLSSSPLCPFASATVFAITPVFAVHGTAAFAEPVSNALGSLILVLFISFVKFSSRGSFHRFLNVLALAMVMALAVLVKRENVLFPLGATLLCCVGFLRQQRRGVPEFALAIGSTLIVLFSMTSIGLAQGLLNESGEYGEFPFSGKGLVVMLPEFLSAFATFGWFSLGGIFVLLGIAESLRKRDLSLLPAASMILFVLIYSSHVRSFYALQLGDVQPVDALRYSMNLMGIWSVLAGVGLCVLADLIDHGLRGRTRTTVAVACCAILTLAGVHSLWATRRLREDMVAQEFSSRVKAALIVSQKASQLAPKGHYILTLEPLLIQMYGSTSTRIVDLNFLTGELLDTLRSEDLVLLLVEQRQYQDPINRNRYATQLAALAGFPAMILHEDDEFTIKSISIERQDAKPAVQ